MTLGMRGVSVPGEPQRPETRAHGDHDARVVSVATRGLAAAGRMMSLRRGVGLAVTPLLTTPDDRDKTGGRKKKMCRGEKINKRVALSFTPDWTMTTRSAGIWGPEIGRAHV